MPELKKPLSREAYMKRVVTKQVELPDGATVCIRALPASLIVSGAENMEKTFETANMLIHSLCDENGALLFADGEKNEALSIDHLALKTILDAIIELNGLKTAKDGNEDAAEKN